MNESKVELDGNEWKSCRNAIILLFHFFYNYYIRFYTSSLFTFKTLKLDNYFTNKNGICGVERSNPANSTF